MPPPTSVWRAEPLIDEAVLRKFTDSLNRLAKRRDNKAITETEFRQYYWAALRRFVKKNGWNPVGAVLGKAGLSKVQHTVIKYGWRYLLGKPPRNRRIRGADNSLMPSYPRLPFRPMGGRRGDCIWW
jgi:hypothetical protein